MYKVVEILPYTHVGIDGKVTTVPEIEDIGVGLFERESSQIYTLICKISKNIGDVEERRKYASLISTLLNENRKYQIG
jgi:hypothetical protein